MHEKAPSLVSVVIPARNEADNIEGCLKSLVSQEGIGFEVYVVDDHSTDRTRQLAESFKGITVLSARDLPIGWKGKGNAIWTAVPFVRGDWILFTDADTRHAPGSLDASVREAVEHDSDLLSYSPCQEAMSLGERCVQPVVFAELNRTFDYAKVNDPSSPVAAANGQYMLFRRSTYFALGGHEAVKASLLEDVDLAKLVKRQGRLRFRYAPERVSTRMYRDFSQMMEGWTKNLFLLFPNSLSLAFQRAFEFLFMVGGSCAGALFLLLGRPLVGIFFLVAAIIAFGLYRRRIHRTGFPPIAAILGVAGMPIFVYLLLRSYSSYHWRHRVSWRGRTYTDLGATD